MKTEIIETGELADGYGTYVIRRLTFKDQKEMGEYDAAHPGLKNSWVKFTPRSPTVEAADLKSVQSEFKSQRGDA